ncbi:MULTISPECIES: hypothetical protein [unclassified Pseudomonas]|uniref:hypothetical protein n=1 Tax=unclassified Pseudomonas TaxID=196821 RepID=UPI0015A3419D|nr:MULTISPECIES: hypothetical protein [unclassified Pseudomonas]NWB23933.1 hypothetical protein [Pseudomonas sp. D4002]NWB64474.1 hypothetical protein [Pseudomonas sp. F1002]
MLKIETKGGDLLKKTLSDLEHRQMPFALARAQTLTAKLVEAAEIEEMSRVFDRPTLFTLNSFFVRPAKKGGPGAVVWVIQKQIESLKAELVSVEGWDGDTQDEINAAIFRFSNLLKLATDDD